MLILLIIKFTNHAKIMLIIKTKIEKNKSFNLEVIKYFLAVNITNAWIIITQTIFYLKVGNTY